MRAIWLLSTPVIRATPSAPYPLASAANRAHIAAMPKSTDTTAAKPKAAKPAPKTVAKVARKKGVRTAHRAAPANNSLGTNPAANPFGVPQ